MDRSIQKVLGLPVFDETFRNTLSDLSLDRIEFWMALADDDDDAPDQKVTNVLPALTSKVELSDAILQRLDMVVTLADMVRQMAPKFQGEIATDLGYGSAETLRNRPKRSLEPAQPIAPKAQAFGSRPGGLGPREEVPSLQEAESAERKKWGYRLQKIAERAGDAAGINDQSRCVGLTPVEAQRLRTMSFEAGGFRQNVRYWEKFEEWAVERGMNVYPPTLLGITGYCLFLKDTGCGPSILPAFKYAVGWVCKKLAMNHPMLDMNDPQLKAIIDQVHLERGKELKEAVPLPVPMVAAMEGYVLVLVKERKDAAAVFLWWALILIYSSLRFDDGVRVSPMSLQMTEDALLGMVWQTKVERKRRGTRFAVPACSVSEARWLEEGWMTFQQFKSDRDYFLWDLQDEKTFGPAPISYARSLAWLKHFILLAIVEASKVGSISLNELEQLQKVADEITWHSMRVTLLSEAVKDNVDEKIIGLQANWKDPRQLVLKYARQRKELSVAMVKGMTDKIKEKWKPAEELFDVEEEEEDRGSPFMPVEYIVKAKLPARSLTSSDIKCHILDPAVSEDTSLCGRLKMHDAESVGPRPTCMICKLCEQKSGS